MCAIILRKVSVLSGLAPEQIEKGIFSHIKSQIKEKTLKDFSVELYLHKILSKIRVLTLKTEHRIGGWLNHLRQRNIERKNYFSEDYWNKIKKDKKIDPK